MSRVRPPLRGRRTLAIGLVTAATLPAATASAHWNEPVPGPLNVHGAQALPIPPGGTRPEPNVRDVEVATIGGKVHAAWTEWDGTNYEAHVARLDGTTWTQLGTGPSPVNRDATRNALDIDIAVLDGKPLIAWGEVDLDDIRQVRVAQFDVAANDWVELYGGTQVNTPRPYPGPQPESDFFGYRFGGSYASGLGVAGGRPFVATAWSHPSGTSTQIHEPNAAGTGWTLATTPATGADPDTLELASDGTTLALLFRGIGRSTLLRRAPDGTWTAHAIPAWLQAVAVRDGDVWYQVQREERSDDPVTGTPGWTYPSAVHKLPAGAAAPVPVGTDVTDGRESGVDGALAFFGGGAYAGWTDVSDEANPKVRVSRLHTGQDWADLEGPVNGAGAATPPPDYRARVPQVDLTTREGLPYVGWVEWNGTRYEVRVARYGDEPLTPTPPAPPAGGGSGEQTGEQQPPAGPDQTAPTPTPQSTPTPGAPQGSGVAVQSASRSRVTVDPRVFRVLTAKAKPAADGRTIRLRVVCRATKGCEGALVARSRGRGKSVTLARGTVSLAHGATGTVTLRTTGEGRRTLRKAAAPFALVLQPR